MAAPKYGLFDQNSEFNLSIKQTIQLLESTGIVRVFRRNYSQLYQLVVSNPRGALKLLLADGAISIQYGKCSFDIRNNMDATNSVEAWKLYEEHVLTYLRLINDTDTLQQAREYIRDRICEEWVRKAPKWPTEGEWGNTYSQSLNEEAEIDGDFYTYIWSCYGTLNMRDYCYEKGKRYKAEIWGNPTIKMKCLRLDKYELNKWNALCSENLNAAKKMAKRANQKPMSVVVQKMQELSWD